MKKVLFKTVSIVIPTYFNELSIPLIFLELQQIESELKKRNCNLELIFVDDGSKDNSWEELLKIKRQRNNTRIIKLTRNFGAVHCSKTGLLFVSGDCFAILAADLQDPPELILEMVDRWLEGKKFIVCKRISRKDPFVTKIFATIYYYLIRFFVISNYPKGGYDMALMDKQLLPFVKNSSKNINTPLYMYWLGYTPEFIKYERRERFHGKSKWSFSKKIKFFLDSLLGFSIVPIRLISAVGIITSGLSFFYGLSVIINALFGIKEVQGFPTLVALTTFLLGLILIILGVIGEYLWRIFDEVNKRPEAVIDEIY